MNRLIDLVPSININSLSARIFRLYVSIEAINAINSSLASSLLKVPSHIFSQIPWMVKEIKLHLEKLFLTSI